MKGTIRPSRGALLVESVAFFLVVWLTGPIPVALWIPQNALYLYQFAFFHYAAWAFSILPWRFGAGRSPSYGTQSLVKSQ